MAKKAKGGYFVAGAEKADAAKTTAKTAAPKGADPGQDSSSAQASEPERREVTFDELEKIARRGPYRPDGWAT
ncbi:hypothetical protein A3C18_02360 [Candidatus Kaiserbacteria bacterium RIFCSPHIGHO2_02_FULL_54_11b]|uniref:Uncharacterized protein n=2 Tax=Candidatus Kaiseribacteriota TaxID=1752734 RepID=A0A1F6CMP0_9BACT|nr:MAG: hypothetical protein A2704_01370 [Candidatus Kaiserbacteria bacterium RIFCSPHIGHO2_01_FULL_54_36b]OGG64169.1 MAG: hypothetical protein A3C18_02360 [Candidatus Kaiserbacteria bacterium RIFCSPHIGHO2_02_FULL_54_11b]